MIGEAGSYLQPNSNNERSRRGIGQAAGRDYLRIIPGKYPDGYQEATGRERPKCPQCRRPLAANGRQRRLTTTYEKCVELGQYTPQMQGTMTRLGGKMPFKQAVEESAQRRFVYVHSAQPRNWNVLK